MSYPFLSDAIEHYTGMHIFLPIPTFGMMVATAILIGGWITRREAKRLFHAGILGMARITPRESKSAPVSIDTNSVDVPPDQIIPHMVSIAAISGLIGARIFHLLEYPKQFIADPMGMIFSRGGLTFLGGLIVGTLCVVFYLRKVGLKIRPMADACAPALMLGYGIGRIGCQIAGDGDWGIAANLSLKPSWIPDFLWTQNYENNIIGAIIPSSGVYPAPLYESLMAFAIFGILWGLRKNRHASGWLFSVYLLFSGIERFLIEKIRVNSTFEIFGVQATQAEILSTIMIALGLLGTILLFRFKKSTKTAIGLLLLGGLATACAHDKNEDLKSEGRGVAVATECKYRSYPA